jgi:hypothetical protein
MRIRDAISRLGLFTASKYPTADRSKKTRISLLALSMPNIIGGDIKNKAEIIISRRLRGSINLITTTINVTMMAIPSQDASAKVKPRFPIRSHNRP